jgi:nitroreductase
MAKHIDVLRERRTIRSFKVKPIEDDDLHLILDAGRWAPSAGNLQNWRFLIIRDEEKKLAIANACMEQTWMADAPVLIVLCSLTEKVEAMYGDRGKFYAIQSTAAAVENIITTAWSLGIGSAWVSAFEEDDLKGFLEIPFDGVDIHAVIALGYPREIPDPPRRLKLADILFFGKYGTRKEEKDFFPIAKHVPKVKKTAQDVIKGILDKRK